MKIVKIINIQFFEKSRGLKYPNIHTYVNSPGISTKIMHKRVYEIYKLLLGGLVLIEIILFHKLFV